MSKKKDSNKKCKGKLKKILISFLLYSLVFITIFSFLDYYSYYIVNLEILIIISLVLGAITTYFHNKFGGRSRIDDLGDKL
ncbi:MAG: hypothetical protein QM503_05980 [Bacteroidota bacterium]